MKSLSDKEKSSFEHIDELRNNDNINFYHEEDVKEFIKRLKEVIDPRIVGAVCCVDMLEEIDKLAGDDLI